MQYVQARADAKDWLSRLAGKTLVCDCSLDAECCWAYILQTSFIDMLDDQITHVPCASTFAEVEHEDPEAMPFETYVAIPDVVDTGLPSDRVIPCAVPWPPSWINLVQKVRSLQRPVMWEIFSGVAVLSTAFAALAISIAPPLDAAASAEYDLLNASFMAVIIGILGSHGVDLVHLAPPCSTFSIALNGNPATRLRTWDEPGGIDGLNANQRRQVLLGNALAEAAATIISVQHKTGNHFQLEQPTSSLMVAFKPMKGALCEADAHGFQSNACADGTP